MKRKSHYILDNGATDRFRFRYDIMREARERGVPVSTILAKFFDSEKFTKKEMGRFALNTSRDGHLVEGAVALMHALGVTAKTASTVRVLEDYIGVSITDPGMWGSSWVIDGMMNWPQGTSLPASRPELAKV